MRSLAALPWLFIEKAGFDSGTNYPIKYVVEKKSWSVKWDGLQICDQINTLQPKQAKISTNPERLIGSVAHFGSQFLWQNWCEHISKSNKIVVSFFHGKRSDNAEMSRHIDFFLDKLSSIDRVVVANTIVEKRMRTWGVPSEKVIRIPIGVDTNLFRPPKKNEKTNARKRFGIGKDSIVIGSFQKDGVGWGDGLEPKWIKGPDQFVCVVEKLSKKFPVHVLLTGPARGFVIDLLKKKNILFTHHYAKNYSDLVQAYHALNLYLVTSREEGGPKALLESLATGVPVISYDVGMASDLFRETGAGLIVNVEDVEMMVEKAEGLLFDALLREKIVKSGSKIIEQFDWKWIAKTHYEMVYQPLLREG